METRTCQNCKKEFTIEEDDFLFYEKIKVPPPTFCPECRIVRRMCWRNCRSLFKRNCFSCDKDIISMYSEEKNDNLLCMDCWNSDKRDTFLYGLDYDFSRSFFEQFEKFRKKIPILYVHHTGHNINCEYTNYIADDKDCYLSYSVIGCENVMYSEVIDKSRNSIDNYSVRKIEGCFYNLDCENNYNTHYAIQSRNCIDSLFVFDCINCQNCCLSSNLRNNQYFFKNKKLTKEKYEEEVKKLKLNTHDGFFDAKKEFDKMISQKAIHRFSQIYNSQNSNGDYIGNSNNIFYSFDVQDSENIKYTVRSVAGAKDCYDNQGIATGELVYESVATSFGTYNDKFTYICVGSKNCEYSMMCKNCSDCFGCIGLKNSQYCIFNKQYQKEEYFEIVENIKQQMNDTPYTDNKGRIYKYGEFFPYEFSPFGYNETNAHDFFRMTKKEAEEHGYPWTDKEEKDYKITIESNDLPNDIADAKDSILNEIIHCPSNGNQLYQCTKAYKINMDELQFYRSKNLPLPRYCPNCRHYQRLIYRNSFKLYLRRCMKEGCVNEFETSYSPDRPEIIYCEECYKKEVY